MYRIITLLFLFFFGFTGQFLSAQSDLRFSEIKLDNDAPRSWAEVCNSGEDTLMLDGYRLGTDPDNAVSLEGGLEIMRNVCLVFSGSSSVLRDEAVYLSGLSIAPAETIFLITPDGEIADQISTGLRIPNHSFGRADLFSDDLTYFKKPAPGEVNTSAVTLQLETPSLSHNPGFYTSSFNLSVSTVHSGAVIRYTTDGSIPDESSPVYEGPVSIESREGDPNIFSMIPTNDFGPGHPYNEEWQPPQGEVYKANVIRARVFFDGAEPSETVTATYFVDEEGTNRFSMPVFSVNTNPENFFDDEIGIYVAGNNLNYNQRGRDWEREGSLEFFEDDGSLAFSLDAGFRIHGGTSRSRPRKSLRIYARNDYGQPWINYQFFPDKPIGQFKRLLLRNSGNDWDGAVFRDGFMQSLMRGIDMDMQHFRPALVFINGEYWGIHNIRDRLDNRYIETHYGLDEDEYTILENNAQFDRGNPDGVDHFNNMVQFLEQNGVNSSSNYEYIQTQMNVGNFADYQIAQIYFRNTDWPGNNLQFWRKMTDYDPDAPFGLDGRWHWMMFDTDFGFGLDFDYVQGANEGPAHNTLAFALEPNGPGWPNPPWSTLILRRLVVNIDFRQHFINRFADLLNSRFSADFAISQIDSIQAIFEPEFPEHIDRWRRPVSMNSWNEEIQIMRDFAEERPGFVRSHIANQFNLNGTRNVTIDVNDAEKGRVRVNTLLIDGSNRGIDDDPYPWSGVYFRQIPVTFTAVPEPGYQFASWSGASTSTETTISIDGSAAISLTANFEPIQDTEIGDLTPWNLAESPYTLTNWPASSPAGSYPESMKFYQTSTQDPGLEDEMEEPWTLPYNLDSRSRINGLGSAGIGFINTANAQDDGGGYMGSAVLALNTEDVSQVLISWRGGTVRPNSRVYNLRMQYRIGGSGEFQDVTDSSGNIIEYERNELEGHSELLGPVALPSAALDRPYVEVRWKYYYTGIRLDDDSGQRSKLRLADILVTQEAAGEATSLSFEEIPTIGQAGHPMPPLRVQALNNQGAADPAFDGVITLSVSEGPGDLTGTVSRQASGGEVLFDDISFTEHGVYRIEASSGNLQAAVSSQVQVTSLTELIMPAYIQGDQPDNNDRVPFVYRVRIEGLTPNATYRYGNRVVDDDDPPTQNGAGNAVFVNDSGDFIRTTDSPRFRDSDYADRHFEFDTDSDGSYEGWFITEPTGNDRFTPGNHLRMRIILNDGQAGTAYKHYITSSSDVRVSRFGSVPGQMTGIFADSKAVPKNFIILYGDEEGETRPVAATVVEDAGFQSDDRYAPFYDEQVNGRTGSWGVMVPNDLPDGLRRIEERSLLDGFVVDEMTSSDGFWVDGVSTINPSGGVSSPLYLPFDTSAPIHDPGELPADFMLSQNYPNPFNPSTQIRYGIPEATHVRLEVYSINGQLITVLQNGMQQAGYHTVTFDSRNANLASGVYLYRLEAGEYSKVKKMLLVK